MKQYKLLKNLPQLKAGAVFNHVKYDKSRPDIGSVGCGALVLAWINGNCQQGWCGETYIFPGQLAEDDSWFKEIEKCKSCNQILP